MLQLLCLAMLTITPVPTRIAKTAQGWEILRDGKPYYVKGVGGSGRLAELAAAGGNTIRTWGAENAQKLLDDANQLGITVTVGHWLAHKQHMNWEDAGKVKEQYERVKADILRHKDHPALLMWGLGNEMEVGGNDTEIVWRAIEDLAKLCKQLDPNHPVMTVVAEIGGEKIAHIKKWAPSIDVLGVNSYGGLATLPKRLKEAGWDKPYVVTEFGPLGPWERPKTAWGAALEPTSTEKAAHYRSNYENSIKSQAGWCLGSFAFLWGDKQEETPTWFGMFLPTGERTEAIDVMTQLWSGKPPANRAPRIGEFSVSAAQQEVQPDSTISAEVRVSDPDGDKLTLWWEVRREATDKRFAGEGELRPGVVAGLLHGVTSPSIRFGAPKQSGAYRLYVYIRDGQGNAATANMPFAVK